MVTIASMRGTPTATVVPPARVHVERLGDESGCADDLERVVGAAAAGEAMHLRDDVAVGRVDRVGRAELQRHVALQRDRVDGDDRDRAGDAGTLDHGLADATAADHRDASSRA